MANHAQHIVAKLWSYCSVLRDDGPSYGDYVEQLTYLLFLKMAHDRGAVGCRMGTGRPTSCSHEPNCRLRLPHANGFTAIVDYIPVTERRGVFARLRKIEHGREVCGDDHSQ